MAPRKKIKKKPEKPKALTQTEVLKFYGGEWPVVETKTYTYPKTPAGWTRLFNQARNFFYREQLAVYQGKKPPQNRLKPKYMYAMYHCKKREKRNRRLRNQHRTKHGLKVGDPAQVHHKDKKNLTFKSTVVVSHCDHQRAHGKVCKNERKKRTTTAKKKK